MFVDKFVDKFILLFLGKLKVFFRSGNKVLGFGIKNLGNILFSSSHKLIIADCCFKSLLCNTVNCFGYIKMLLILKLPWLSCGLRWDSSAFSHPLTVLQVDRSLVDKILLYITMYISNMLLY